ncbi:unnamed protein product [Laminaria digitata]
MSKVGLVTTFRFVPAAAVLDEKGQATLERCWSALSSFLLFHLAKGVEHVFLYADADDGSNQVYVERIAENFHSSQVSVHVRNESQREGQQATCRLWRELGAFSATEVPARQSLNAEDAMRKAGEMGLDWLLHLDIDELFYTSEASIRSHFEHLNELGVEQMTYANHEAVPYREDICDYFCEVDMFRVNHLTLPLSRAVGEGTRFWRRRTGHGQYMLAYDNGKAAVKVLPGKVVPQSVHRWRTLKPSERDCNPIGRGEIDCNATGQGERDCNPIGQGERDCNPIGQGERDCTPIGQGEIDCIPIGQGERDCNPIGQGAGDADDIIADAKSPPERQGAAGCEKSACGRCGGAEGSAKGMAQSKHKEENDRPVNSGGHLVNRSALPDPRELRLAEFLECSDPCILHYPSCGLDWLRDKYLLLGSFPSSWFGGNLPIAPSFHLDARNAALGDVAPPPAGSNECEEAKEGEDRSRELYRKEVMLSFEDHAEEVRAQLDHGVLRIITDPVSVIDRARNVIREAPGSRVTPSVLPATAKTQHGVGEGSEGRTGWEGGASAALALAAAMGGSGVPTQSSASATATACSGRNVSKATGDLAGEDSAENIAAAADFENSWIMAACLRDFL